MYFPKDMNFQYFFFDTYIGYSYYYVVATEPNDRIYATL